MLQGVRVLDLSRLLPGPFLTQVLADLGASVIKVEEPRVGDPARLLAPEAHEWVNASKRIVALDLRTRAGVKPVYVSVGHRIGLESAAAWVLRLCRGRRLPEPIRVADQLSKGAQLGRPGDLA